MLSTTETQSFFSSDRAHHRPHHELSYASLSQSRLCFIPANTALYLSGKSEFGLDNLQLFANVPEDFNPETEWLDGSTPAHPFFDNSLRIQAIIRNMKDDLLHHTLQGCKVILSTLSNQEDQEISFLRQTLDEKRELWKAIMSAQLYGVIYMVNRLDAKQYFSPLIPENLAAADAIDLFLRQDAVAIRAINYAVHCFVTKGTLRVENPTCFVPPNAISSIGYRHVAVRKQDFEKPVEDVLADLKPLWDLHDFAHLTTATLSPELFGNEYHAHLIKLEPSLTALVRSPGMRTGKGPRISDGLIFSELLTGLFAEETEAVAKQQKSHTYKSLTATLANTVADYLLGRRALYHPSTQQMIKLDTPVTPTQLAVLAQNKAYELPASEIEQRVFTRGGTDDRDPLFNMTARQRIEFLARSRSWTYFEVRNTVKHRAHKESYRLVAIYFLENGTELELSRKILESVTYEDWEKTERENLWSLLK